MNCCIDNRISEKASVSAQAADGMATLVERVAQNRGSGGRSREVRSLLQTILMCVMRTKGEDSVSKEAIRRQILPSLSIKAAHRLMKKAGEKRKRFMELDLSEFKIVEEEEKRWKYSTEEIEDLRRWMCDNLYTRKSPNAKDTIRKRDLNGKYVYVY
jgi:hypothetical protein